MHTTKCTCLCSSWNCEGTSVWFFYSFHTSVCSHPKFPFYFLLCSMSLKNRARVRVISTFTSYWISCKNMASEMVSCDMFCFLNMYFSVHVDHGKWCCWWLQCQKKLWNSTNNLRHRMIGAMGRGRPGHLIKRMWVKRFAQYFVVSCRIYVKTDWTNEVGFFLWSWFSVPVLLQLSMWLL